MDRKPFLHSLILLLAAALLTACSGPRPSASPVPQNGVVETIVAGTLQAIASVTPVPSQVSTLTAGPAIPAGWILYKSDEFGFEFAHPGLHDCKDQCSMSAFINLGDIVHIATLAVESTITSSGAPFDAISFDVFQNPQALSLQDFVEQEQQAILSGPMPIGPPAGETPITIAGQTGIKMSFHGNVSAAIYLPFPAGHQILIISISNASEGSFEVTADQILGTLHFIK